MAALEAWWDRLRLGELFGGKTGDAVPAMVANRLVDPSSKRKVPEWVDNDVAMPSWFVPPLLYRYYRCIFKHYK